eukprot:1158112-Pelagomonas_calceolata.AAC.1
MDLSMEVLEMEWTWNMDLKMKFFRNGVNMEHGFENVWKPTREAGSGPRLCCKSPEASNCVEKWRPSQHAARDMNDAQLLEARVCSPASQPEESSQPEAAPP